jgi:hypothetical protein
VAGGDFARAAELAHAALRDGIPPDTTAPVLPYQALSIIEFITDDYPQAVAWTDRAIADIDELGIDDLFGRAILASTRVAWMTIRRDEADFRDEADRAVALARASGRPSAISIAIFTQTVGTWRDDPAPAGPKIDEAIAISQAGGNAVVRGYMLALRAQIASVLGEHRDALAFLRASLIASRDKGDIPMLITSVAYSIQVMARAGLPDGAALAAGAAVDGPASFYGTLPAHELPDHEWAQARARELLGNERGDARRAVGASMTLDDVVTELVREIDDAIRDRPS